MKHALILAGAVPLLALAAPAHADSSCAALAHIRAPQMTIIRADELSAPGQIDPALSAASGNEPLCRVSGFLTPTKDSHIGFELWLPASARWNRKLHSVGNGGLLGALNLKAMAPGFKRGYATLTTDLGHLNTPPGAPEDPSWAPGHPDKIVDYAYRGEHLATVAAKQIISVYYRQSPKHAFYTGCSAGGITGLNELLRYPKDYDGYIVGAATPDHLGQEIGAMWNTLAASLSSQTDALLASQANALHAAILRQCAGKDGGAPGDAFLSNPSACQFDPSTVQCRPGQEAKSCLSPAQVAIVRKVYGGPVNPRTGAMLFSGLTYGTELGWQRFFLGKTNPVGLDRPWAGFMALMAYDDPTWLSQQRYLKFDFDHDLDQVRAKMVGGESLDSSWTVRNRNLDTFAEVGGKVIQYHGWDDPNIPALEAVRFHRELIAALMVRKHLSEAGAEAVVNQYHRLFMVPGMGHCSGGAGPDSFGQTGQAAGPEPDQDALGALERWVEAGKAPDHFVASRTAAKPEAGSLVVNENLPVTRPVCLWPAAPRWDGKGDPKVAASFSCAIPSGQRAAKPQ